MAGFELTLTRKMRPYFIRCYLPSGVFVIVSWISFLVPPEIVAGRLGLLITLFLVLVNIFNTITTNIPNADGKKHKIFHKPMFSIDRGFKMYLKYEIFITFANGAISKWRKLNSDTDLHIILYR